MEKTTYLLKKRKEKSLQHEVKIQVSDYKDLFFTLSDLLKVAVLALDSEENTSRFIVDSRSNIKALLEIAIQMIPFQEAAILDEILLEKKENNSS
ncbi:hypothetical protein [Flavobacterium orientale]|uniref:Uncharacterized protein n=1 Tax=Flavobacterium orientale TaxID=1756020 RepID=A0A917DF71_9FLAO|nr:hypothetical protein [Flavobacterium orientale]GGD35310.1 hypothetical protein GCM10011343_26440 [Flavobacterium orientale]